MFEIWATVFYSTKTKQTNHIARTGSIKSLINQSNQVYRSIKMLLLMMIENWNFIIKLFSINQSIKHSLFDYITQTNNKSYLFQQKQKKQKKSFQVWLRINWLFGNYVIFVEITCGHLGFHFQMIIIMRMMVIFWGSMSSTDT